MAYGILLRLGELGHGLAQFRDEEDGVIAEAVVPEGCPDDGATALAGEQLYGKTGPDDGDDAAEAGAQGFIGDGHEFFQEQGDVLGVGGVVTGETGGADARLAAEGIHLDGGVVGEGGQPAETGVTGGLEGRVLLEGGAGLGDCLGDSGGVERDEGERAVVQQPC